MRTILILIMLFSISTLAKDYSISVRTYKYEANKIIISIDTDTEVVDFIEKDPGDDQEALQLLVKKVITDYKKITANDNGKKNK